jgi:hypothetical protein
MKLHVTILTNDKRDKVLLETTKQLQFLQDYKPITL